MLYATINTYNYAYTKNAIAGVSETARDYFI